MSGTGTKPGSGGIMPKIVTTTDVLGGDPRIENSRIGVLHVYQRYVDGGETPEEIATAYDISIAEVHTALAYAFSNPAEMHALESRNRDVYEQSTRIVPDEDA